MKYKTLKELRDAFAAGQLDKDTRLLIDNDSCFCYQDDETLFESDGPEYLLEEALDLLGIPNEHV